MCKVLGVSRSGYYKWLQAKPSKSALRRMSLMKDIKYFFEESLQCYGSPRIHKDLQQEGIKASRPLVAKLMKEQGLYSIIRRKYKKTTDSSHQYPVAPNILGGNFHTEKENQVWVSDISYIPTWQGWMYLTTVIDLFDRKVIGWAMSNNLTTKDTSINAFRMALQHRPLRADQSLVFHSDRGIQYACREFVKELEFYKNITRSMSGKGNCYDNAVAESFFKTLKVELVYHNKYRSILEAKNSIFKYIEGFYNNNRRHSYLGNLTIREFRNLIINNSKNAA